MILRPYQEELLREIERSRGQVLVSVPPGGGKSAVISEFIASTKPGLTVIVTDRQELADQWAARLRGRGLAVVVVESASDLLDPPRVANSTALPVTLILTIHRLRGSIGHSFADRCHADLVVVDMQWHGPETASAAAVSALVQGAHHSLWLTNLGTTTLLRNDGFDSAIVVPLRSILEAKGAELTLTNLTYDNGPADLVLSRGRELLRTAGVQSASSDIQGLHGDLLLAASRGVPSGGDPEDEPIVGQLSPTLQQELWEVVDALESVAVDGRLEAYLLAVQRAQAQGSVCLTLATKISDMEYLAAELSTRGFNASVVASHVPPSDRAEALSRFASDGTALIAGYSIMDQIGSTSRPLVVILWSQTHSYERMEQVVIWASTSAAEVVTLSPADSSFEGNSSFRMFQEVVAHLELGDAGR